MISAGLNEHFFRRFSPRLWRVVALSLLIGLAAIAPILFNLSIYDNIIASGTTTGLPMLLLGAILGLCAEIALRHARANQIAHFSTRFSYFSNLRVFQKIIALPLALSEKAMLGSQVSRMRNLDNIRDFFCGSVAPLIFEIPLIIIYLGFMALLSGWLALIPALLLLTYTTLIAVMAPRIKELSKLAGRAQTQKNEFQLESLRKISEIRASGLEDIWQKKWSDVLNNSSWTQFHVTTTAQAVETASYALMTCGAVLTLCCGVYAVVSGSLSIGGLIAAMMLLWRVLSPMQLACASISKFQQLADTASHIIQTLNTPDEQSEKKLSAPHNLTSGLQFHRVTLRYPHTIEPAVLSISFEAKKGQFIAICGNNGAGKSTLLKLALGLYTPQGGAVRWDGQDIRQFHASAFRNLVTYIGQDADFITGTVRDNLCAKASDNECYAALERFGALDMVLSLPNILETKISYDIARFIPHSLKARLCLARAELRNRPLLLMDEIPSLGEQDDAKVLSFINDIKSQVTVLMVTHREDFIRMSDTMVVLNKGELTHAGSPMAVLPTLKAIKI